MMFGTSSKFGRKDNVGWPADSPYVAFDPLNIALISQTGNGKSTLVNYFHNYYRKVMEFKQSNVEVLIPNRYWRAKQNAPRSSERHIERTGESQTSRATTYQMASMNLIDTPGLADTRGIEYDEHNIGLIADALVASSWIDAIIIVLNGTVVRETAMITYVFSRLCNFIPKGMEDNIYLVLTNCSSASAANYESELQRTLEIPSNRVFFMNNMAFSSDPNSWSEDDLEDVERSWKRSMKSIDSLVKTITAESRSISTSLFGSMKSLRQTIHTNQKQCRESTYQLVKTDEERDALQEKIRADLRTFESKVNNYQLVLVPGGCILIQDEDELDRLCYRIKADHERSRQMLEQTIVPEGATATRTLKAWMDAEVKIAALCPYYDFVKDLRVTIEMLELVNDQSHDVTTRQKNRMWIDKLKNIKRHLGILFLYSLSQRLLFYDKTSVSLLSILNYMTHIILSERDPNCFKANFCGRCGEDLVKKLCPYAGGSYYCNICGSNRTGWVYNCLPHQWDVCLSCAN